MPLLQKKITKRISSNFGDSIETVSDFEMIQKILNNIQIP